MTRSGFFALIAGAVMCVASTASAAAIRHVFVIVMENTDADQIYGSADAPFINNDLLPKFAHAAAFRDSLPHRIPSEPHYILMEAGTRKFADRTFKNDKRPSRENSTASTEHLVSQLESATPPRTWMTYQEDVQPGVCPVKASGLYAPKHNPFVFFQDVSGNPPSADSPRCIAHVRPYGRFAADLAAGDIADYVFITPNLCHDMHGADDCERHTIVAGDDWLKSELPRIIDWSKTNAGVIFIAWDEGDKTQTIPFLAIGPGVKANYAGSVEYTHGSILKSVEQIFGVPILPTVAAENDLSDLFQPGAFP